MAFYVRFPLAVSLVHEAAIFERETGAFVYKFSTAAGPTRWMVFYPNDQALAKVKHAMGHY
jgi:hypothetical protein